MDRIVIRYASAVDMSNGFDMTSAVNVLVHPSQFPEAVRRDLIESLRSGEVRHKFHYDSIKQSQKWLAVHRAYAPVHQERDSMEVYQEVFRAAVRKLQSQHVSVIGLGPGSGEKDGLLLELLRREIEELSYIPCDVGTAMVLMAYNEAAKTIDAKNCHPFICDLAGTDLSETLGALVPPKASRVVTFFGMIPNFEPEAILPKLAAALKPEDLLLFSANLAPGTDYLTGVKHVLPQYDNALTREWLLTFLLDLGVERGDGEIKFSIEGGGETGVFKRIVARHHFSRSRTIAVDNETFHFSPQDSIRLLFSYRYTPVLLEGLLERYGILIQDRWINVSGEEGVFLCCRQTG